MKTFLSLTLLLAILSPAAKADSEQIACAAGLHEINRWVVPGAGYQAKIRNYFDPERKIIFLPEKGSWQKFFVITESGNFTVTPTRAPLNPNLYKRRQLFIHGLPIENGPAALKIETAIGLSARPVPAKSLPEGEAFQHWGESFNAIPATQEESAQADATFIESFRYLWKLRENIKEPSYTSYLPNSMHQNSHPDAGEIEIAETACANFFVEGPKPASQKSERKKSPKKTK